MNSLTADKQQNHYFWCSEEMCTKTNSWSSSCIIPSSTHISCNDLHFLMQLLIFHFLNLSAALHTCIIQNLHHPELQLFCSCSSSTPPLFLLTALWWSVSKLLSYNMVGKEIRIALQDRKETVYLSHLWISNIGFLLSFANMALFLEKLL